MTRRNALAATVAILMVMGSIAVSVVVLDDGGSRTDEVGELAAADETVATVVEDRVIDDLVYATSDTVPTTTMPSGPADGQAASPDPTPLTEGQAALPWSAQVAAAAPSQPASDVGTAPRRPGAAPTTSAPRSTTTTTAPAPAPPTTWPPGTELPESWPAGLPYPPMPAGCRKPHLEDDGEWNCEH